MKRAALLLAAGLLLAVNAISYTGAGGVWVQKKGDFFGKNFDGTRAGIQQANDYCRPVGGLIQVGVGQFSIDQTLVLDCPGLTIAGQGDSTVFVNSTAGGDTIIAIHADNVTVRNFRINGQKSATRVLGQGVWVNGRAGVTIEGLTIRDMPDAAIHVHLGSSDAIVRGNRISRTGQAGAAQPHGIIIHETVRALVHGNEIDATLGNGVWQQGASRDVSILGNIITNTVADAIALDPGGRRFNVGGNTITGAASDGITQDTDSTAVWNNVITGAQSFGLWSTAGGNGSTWTGNVFNRCGNYSMSLEATEPLSGWLIAGNFSMWPNGIGLEIQANIGPDSVTNVQVVGNYFIGTGLNKPAIRITPVNGLIRRVSIMDNVVKQSVNHGLEVDVVGGGSQVEQLIITGNHFLNNYGRGIAAKSITLASTGHVSGNFSFGNGMSTGGNDYDSLASSGWTWERLGRGRIEGSTIVAGDTLRVGTLLGPLGRIVATGSLTSGGDVFFGGNLAQSTIAGPLTPSSDDNGNIQFRSNGSYQAGLVFRDTTGTYFPNLGAGTRHKAMWLEANRDLYLMPFPTTRAISFRSPSDTSEVMRVASSVSVPTTLAVTNKLTQSGDRALFVDSVRVGLTSQASPLTVTGPITSYGRGFFLDSLRVVGSLAVGQKSGVPQYNTFGNGGTGAGDTVTVDLNATDFGGYSPRLVFRRNGAAVSSFTFNGTNNTWRIDPAANKFWRWGTLNSETTNFVATMDNTGKLELGTGTPGYKLEVNGDSYLADSVRAVGGVKIGSATAVNIRNVYASPALLDFDLSSATCQDLTMTVTGAAVGDPVFLATPTAPVDGSVTGEADNQATAWVSAANTVTVRLCRNGAAHNPDAGVFVATVFHY